MFATSSYNAALILLVALNLDTVAGQGQLQVLRFYSGANCTSNFTSVHDSGNFTESYVQNLSSIMQNGMWKVVACVDNSTCSLPLQPVLVRDHCREFITTANTTRIQALRYGDANQTSAKMYLYRASYLQFESVEVGIEGINIPSSMNMGSFYFTGYHRWGTYSWTNFTGLEDCFGPDSDVINSGYGFTYRQSLGGYIVRSVRFNLCNGTELPTTLQPPTTETEATSRITLSTTSTTASPTITTTTLPTISKTTILPTETSSVTATTTSKLSNASKSGLVITSAHLLSFCLLKYIIFSSIKF